VVSDKVFNPELYFLQEMNEIYNYETHFLST